MSAKKAWWLYTLLRVLFFAVPFGILVWLLPAARAGGINLTLIFIAVCSAVIALALSLLFLNPLRERAALGVDEYRKKRKTRDDEDEDEELGVDDTAEDTSSSHAEPGA